MSWLGEGWQYRWPILVQCGAGVVNDINVGIDGNWDWFWDAILPLGADVRFTACDGVTQISYAFSGAQLLRPTNQSVSVNMQGVTYSGSALFTSAHRVLIWMYWGNPGVSDAQGQGGQGTVSAFIGPTGPAPFEPVIMAIHEPVGTTTVSQSVPLVYDNTGHERMAVWWDITDTVRTRYNQQNGSHAGEELRSVIWRIVDSTGANVVGNMMHPTHIQAYEVNGRFYIKTHILTPTVNDPWLYEMQCTFAESPLDPIFRKYWFRCAIERVNPQP